MLRIRIAAFSLLLASCQTMPEKPIVEVGGVDYPADQVIAGLSDGSDPVHRVPLSTYDKATCFKPKEWEREKVYIKLLEDFGRRCQQVIDGQK